MTNPESSGASSVVRTLGYAAFGKLRLADFLAPGDERLAKIYLVYDWEYQGGRWIGEGLTAFTTFMRPEQRPDDVGAIELDLVELDEDIAAAILARLQLPISAQSTRQDAEHIFGHASEEYAYVPDRISLDFLIGEIDKYRLSLTIHHRGGLIYISIIKLSLYDRLMRSELL